MKDTTPRKLRVASVSDIHLGHPRTPTVDILANLRLAFPDNEETAALDIIFIAGDVFHTLLFLNNEDVTEIDLWFIDLLRICAKHGIKLRVLEGTPSHDRNQCRRFPVINEFAEIGADFKYVKDVSIEHIEEYGITVLYVPDEANPTPEKTLSQVRELMQARGLTQVDYAIMHGQFEYQLPAHVKAHKHDSEAYLALVKFLIFVGHVHTSSRCDRILAQGSFDRIAHGEPEAKGHYRATVWDNGEMEIQFVENKGAKKFITLTFEEGELEDTLANIAEKVADLPPYSHVRIEVPGGHPLLANMDTLARRWPYLHWAKKQLAGEEEAEQFDEPALEQEYVPITITRDNIVDMVMIRLAHNDSLAPNVMVAARKMLEGIVK